jgi:hypothetical protein
VRELRLVFDIPLRSSYRDWLDPQALHVRETVAAVRRARQT